MKIFESIAAWIVVALFAIGVWLIVSALWGTVADARVRLRKPNRTSPLK